jgi:glycosyltransferase involved in cell wall biosynthesis
LIIRFIRVHLCPFFIFTPLGDTLKSKTGMKVQPALKSKAPVVFIFAYWFDPRWKEFVGPTVKIRDLADNFVRQGFRVVAFLPQIGFDRYRYGFRIIQVPFVNLPLVRFISFNGFLAVYLIVHLARVKADVFYIRRMASPLPALIGKLAGAGVGYEVNDNPFDGQYQEGSRLVFRLRRQVAALMDRLNMCLADKSFVISDAVLQAIRSRSGRRRAGRLVLLPSGANTELFQPADITACREKLNLSVSVRHVGFAGTLLRHQGVDVLIDAALKVTAVLPRSRFVIIGEGPMKPFLLKRVSDLGLDRHFVFTGQVAYERLPDWIGAMDICVAPYRRSAGLRSPVKMFDYLACARPVVASRIDGTTDLFEASAAVMLVAPEDPDALAKGLIGLLEQQEQRHRMGLSGRRFVAGHFNRDRLAKRISRELNLA